MKQFGSRDRLQQQPPPLLLVPSVIPSSLTRSFPLPYPTGAVVQQFTAVHMHQVLVHTYPRHITADKIES